MSRGIVRLAGLGHEQGAELEELVELAVVDVDEDGVPVAAGFVACPHDPLDQFVDVFDFFG